jgi:hypothetical protein
MLKYVAMIALLFTGCSVNTQLTIKGQYADTRIFANNGEIGIAVRPNVATIRVSQGKFTR